MYSTDSTEKSVRTIEHQWIPLADGTRLAARIWLPADETPVPAVLEYIPYRKNDATAARDLSLHPEFARNGYAAVRVDLRGSGDSDAIMADEYAPSELDDGLQVIQWIAEQDWCDGAVGIIGKSWGGFNGLQLAALRPPALAAVISVCSTDDRYADDVHYNGGVVLASEMLPWASTMLAYNGRPPDPAVVGDGWRDQWLERLEQSPQYIETWLSHQRRDAYWKHGSVIEDYSAIEVPILAVGGLYDEYRTTLFRLMEGCSAPVHALLGPWAHNYPHQGTPGPAIDFIGESVRWWDRWLKKIPNEVDTQPQLRAFLPTSTHPDADKQDRTGRWISEPTWPSPYVETRELAFADAEPAGDPILSSTAAIGADAGDWLQFGDPLGMPVDQTADDAASFTVTWPELSEATEFIGIPEVTLTVTADRPLGLVAVRLCDVGPDGSRLITAGLRNLTHETDEPGTDHEHPVPLAAGVPRRVRIPLLAAAHRFEAGQRIRVSVSASYWPWAWPSPEPTRVQVVLDAANALHLPTRRETGDECADPVLHTAPRAYPQPITGEDRGMTREVELVDGVETITISDAFYRTNPASGIRYESSESDIYRRDPVIPGSESVECVRGEAVGRAGTDWMTRVETRSRMSATATHFDLVNELTAFEGTDIVFNRTWTMQVPRDHG